MSAVDQAESLIENGAARRVHMLGIGGIGMAGLARLLQQRGLRVSGCDAQAGPQTEWLQSHGVQVELGHAADHVSADVDWVIRTTAVPDSHPEVIAAQALGIPVLRRGEVLPAVLRGRRTIAVSGTHGKTTTSALIVQTLRGCGIECGWCIGGEIPGLDGVAGDGPLMVVEADESDGTAALYSPEIAVITNIEYDHMEHHADEQSFINVFRRFAAQADSVIYCAEDPISTQVCAELEHARGYQSTGKTPVPNFALPGQHNQLNACAVRSVGEMLGLTDAAMLTALQSVKAPLRRFEIISKKDGITIVSDYAHHPTEIRCLIESARSFGPRRIIAVFQPHRYTRTQALGENFPPAFDGVDALWITPVYAASESPIAGGTSADLCDRFSKDWAVRLHQPPTLAAAWSEIKPQLRSGDMLLIIGAGDIIQLTRWV